MKLRTQIESGVWRAGGNMPSLRSLADRYGVSLNTVQKAVRELSALDLIDQQPGQSGVIKSVRRSRPAAHQQIAWIEGYDPETVSSYWSEEIMRNARAMLTRADLRVTVLTYQYRQPDIAGQVMRLLEPIAGQIAGVFCPSIIPLLPVIEHIEQMGLPWMTVSPIHSSINHNFVSSDDLGGGSMAGRCFANLGVRRLAVLHFGIHELSQRNKTTGLCRGYLEQGQAPPVIDLVCCHDQEARSGHEAMAAYLKNHEPPQGIFATGDWLAVGAIRAVQEAGLRVPQDISVMGSTGIPSNRLLFSPTLAAIAQPVRQLGEQIATGLIHMVREGVSKVAGQSIPCQFIPGQSLNVPESIQKQWVADSLNPVPSQNDQTVEDSTANSDVSTLITEPAM
ncbi:MAG: GntR family transcriptional regulator [Phycisphaerales bacterium]|nr:GntR family transcriptional regulator [Phycisphaerales bacterium]